MYNHYKGNTGKVRRVEEPRPAVSSAKAPAAARTGTYPPAISSVKRAPAMPQGRPFSAPPAPRPQKRPPSPPSGLSGELGKLMGRFSHIHLESEDMILLLILYLMYRESGDEELLWIIAAMIFL